MIAASVVIVVVAAVIVAIPIRKALVTAQACATVTEYAKTNGAIQTIGDGPVHVAVLGDSYTAGDELKNRNDRWVNQLAKNTPVAFDGVGMTGFVNGGFCGGQTFADRIDGILSISPDVLIIQGGANDWESDRATIVKAAKAVLATAVKVPTVIVIGPTNSPARPSVGMVDAALRNATESAGRSYVSALHWNVEFEPDGVHMTPSGHRLYAIHVAAAIAGG